MNTSEQTVAVIGATGKVGRHVVDGLAAHGVRVRALTRAPARARLPAPVEVRAADLSDPASVGAATAGADAIFLLWPGFSADGAAGVIDALPPAAYVVYLSAAKLQGEPSELGGPTPGVWEDVEKLIDGAGLSRTFLRAGGFAGNTLSWAGAIRAGQPVALPVPLAGRSLVHERDLADVAVLALTDRQYAGEAYVLTGPQTLTQVQQVETIAGARRTPVAWVEQSLDDARRELSTFMGAEGAASAAAYWASLVDQPEQVSGDVERVTGHPARSFAEWARDHVGDFA